MLKEIIVTATLGAVSYLAGSEIGEKLPYEKALEIVDKHKETYKNLTASKTWLSNTVINTLLTTPLLGLGLGSLGMGVKGLERGAYKVVGEQKPFLPVSSTLEASVMVITGAEGMRNTRLLLKREKIDPIRTIKIAGASSIILAPTAIIEEEEIKKHFSEENNAALYGLKPGYIHNQE